MAGMPAVQKALAVTYLENNWNAEQQIAERRQNVETERKKLGALTLALAEAQQRQREAEVEVKRAKDAAARIKAQLARVTASYEHSCLILDDTEWRAAIAEGKF